jgi:nucleoside-diphosphate-sugar epimerase
VIGPGDTNWLPRIISLRQRDALKQVGNGTNTVNFTSIENLLDAIDLALVAPPEAMGETYNIHNGIDEKFWEVVEMGLREVGLDGKRRKVPLTIAMGLATINETAHRILRSKQEPSLLPVTVGVSAYSFTMDISKAKTRLNYSPRQTTKQALYDFGRWYQTEQAIPTIPAIARPN